MYASGPKELISILSCATAPSALNTVSEHAGLADIPAPDGGLVRDIIKKD